MSRPSGSGSSTVRGLVDDQRVRFLAVGGFNTVLGYVTFSALTLWVFHEVRFGYLLSLVGSYAIGISVAFVLYRRLVFKVQGQVMRDFVRFVTVYAVSIGINAVVLPVLVEVAGVPPLAAQAVVVLITTLLSFVGHRSFSFRRDEDVAQDDV
ncbi:GtrA family protein [Aeromicrobium endophyticum]|uniref:GtrA family protein n=1 Tax=Aeromicrobium endophyticum TaxID=2292704 RepID=A0A371P245_9ACTN|nr:GtrA family protein [Aeromicrobium endophyticum]REK69678.1 GtrA family protein [Aeromicrobium endophyticum]